MAEARSHVTLILDKEKKIKKQTNKKKKHNNNNNTVSLLIILATILQHSADFIISQSYNILVLGEVK